MASALLAGATAVALGAFVPGELPPKPPATHVESSKAWEAMEKGAEFVKPEVRRSPVRHGPAMRLGRGEKAREGNAVDSQSYNWAGTVVLGAAGQYQRTVMFQILAIPTVGEPFGTICGTGTAPRYVSSWVGLDGFASGTVEQAGWDIATACNLAQNTLPFVEAFPASGVQVTNFPTDKGDVVVNWVWVTGTGTTCGAWLNQSRNAFTELCVPNPGPVQVDSLEFIVERPVAGGQLLQLGNYARLLTRMAFGYDAVSGQVQGGIWYQGTGQSITFLTMLDDQNQPQAQFVPDWLWSGSFYAEGSAYCAPGFVNCPTPY